MSIYTIAHNWLSIGPRAYATKTSLYLRTSTCVRLLTLFSWNRQVWVDAQKKEVVVTNTFLWVLRKTRRLPFARIRNIDYDFKSLGTDWGLSLNGFGRQDQFEQFTIKFQLQEPREKLCLFSFYGEGAVETGWSGFLIGDDSLFDFSGTQEASSQRIVHHLKILIGCPLGTPVEMPHDERGHQHVCEQCARPNALNAKKCLYCGGPIRVDGRNQI